MYGETVAEAADTYAAFLDSIEVDKVIVHSVSGGGPSGIHLAVRHPDRVYALILESACPGTYVHP